MDTKPKFKVGEQVDRIKEGWMNKTIVAIFYSKDLKEYAYAVPYENGLSFTTYGYNTDLVPIEQLSALTYDDRVWLFSEDELVLSKDTLQQVEQQIRQEINYGHG